MAIGNAQCPAQVTKMGQVPEQLANLNKAVEHLESVSQAVLARCTVVILSVPPTGADEGPRQPDQQLCDLANQLRELTRSIQAVNGKLSEASERIEL